jgi:DNA adenine methylase
MSGSPSLITFPSPLRYPGGKGKVANFVKLVLLANRLLDIEYVEPYAGGAGIALTLLYEDYVDSIVINDIDAGVHAFWSCVVHRADELCALIETVPLTMEEWHRQRAIQQAEMYDELALGFSTFFLNRTNRSGIISESGVIGGKSQTGPWKIDARFSRDNLIQRIRKVARFRNRVTVSNLDAAELLGAYLNRSDALLYLDPPYYDKGADLYENHYSHDDHAQIARLVSEVQGPWIVSYDAVDQVRQMYSRFPSIAYSLDYSASERRVGSEMMFFSKSLVIPEVESPARVPSSLIDQARIA